VQCLQTLSHYFKDTTARLKSQSLKYHVYTMRMRKYRDKNIRVWCEYLVSSQTKFAVAGVCGNSLVNFCTAETELFTVFDWFTAFQLNFLIFTIFQPLSSYYLELSIATPLKTNYLLFSYFYSLRFISLIWSCLVSHNLCDLLVCLSVCLYLINVKTAEPNSYF